MKATRLKKVKRQAGRLSERIWPQARRAREAALRSRPSTERNEASGQRRRSNRALFYRGQYSGVDCDQAGDVRSDGATPRPTGGSACLHWWLPTRMLPSGEDRDGTPCQPDPKPWPHLLRFWAWRDPQVPSLTIWPAPTL